MNSRFDFLVTRFAHTLIADSGHIGRRVEKQ